MSPVRSTSTGMMRFESRVASFTSQAQVVDLADVGESRNTIVSASAMSAPSRLRGPLR
jgi:hypothetical protein